MTAWVRPDQMYKTLNAISGALEPVDATCKCATADCSHYGGIDCEACGCKTPASDPTPELRERIAKVLYAQDSDAGPVFYAQEYADGVDAVLAALGEKK